MYKTIYKDLRHLQHSSSPVASGISGQVPKGSCIVQGKCEQQRHAAAHDAVLRLCRGFAASCRGAYGMVACRQRRCAPAHGLGRLRVCP